MFNTIITALLIPVAVLFNIVFVKGLIDLREEEKGDLDRYIDQIFGKDNSSVYKSILDDETGQIRHIVYGADYQWFKTPEYKWFEVYEVNEGYQHIEIEK